MRLELFVFSIDFNGSENLALEGGGLVLHVTVEPYNRVAVGRLVVVDRSKPCRLNNKYKWTLEAPDWQDMQRTQLVDAAKIQRQLRTASSLGFGDESLGLGFVKRACLENSVHFLDASFPPLPTSLYGGGDDDDDTAADDEKSYDQSFTAPKENPTATSPTAPTTTTSTITTAESTTTDAPSPPRPSPANLSSSVSAINHTSPRLTPSELPLTFKRPYDFLSMPQQQLPVMARGDAESGKEGVGRGGCGCGSWDERGCSGSSVHRSGSVGGRGLKTRAPLAAWNSNESTNRKNHRTGVKQYFRRAAPLFPPEGGAAAITPSDICQGALTDCWFLSALSALAEHPDIIQNIFIGEEEEVEEEEEEEEATKHAPFSSSSSLTPAHGGSGDCTYASSGGGGDSSSFNKGRGCLCGGVDGEGALSVNFYKVRLCKGGVWRVVVVDDYFPCWPGPGGRPAYSRSRANDCVWVMVLEKAYAKLHGSYAAIRNGWAYEAMIDLTGSPSRRILFKDHNVSSEFLAAGNEREELSTSQRRCQRQQKPKRRLQQQKHQKNQKQQQEQLGSVVADTAAGGSGAGVGACDSSSSDHVCKPADLWENLLAWHALGYPMSCSTEQNDSSAMREHGHDQHLRQHEPDQCPRVHTTAAPTTTAPTTAATTATAEATAEATTAKTAETVGSERWFVAGHAYTLLRALEYRPHRDLILAKADSLSKSKAKVLNSTSFHRCGGSDCGDNGRSGGCSPGSDVSGVEDEGKTETEKNSEDSYGREKGHDSGEQSQKVAVHRLIELRNPWGSQQAPSQHQHLLPRPRPELQLRGGRLEENEGSANGDQSRGSRGGSGYGGSSPAGGNDGSAWAKGSPNWTPHARATILGKNSEKKTVQERSGCPLLRDQTDNNHDGGEEGEEDNGRFWITFEELVANFLDFNVSMLVRKEAELQQQNNLRSTSGDEGCRGGSLRGNVDVESTAVAAAGSGNSGLEVEAELEQTGDMSETPLRQPVPTTCSKALSPPSEANDSPQMKVGPSGWLEVRRRVCFSYNTGGDGGNSGSSSGSGGSTNVGINAIDGERNDRHDSEQKQQQREGTITAPIFALTVKKREIAKRHEEPSSSPTPPASSKPTPLMPPSSSTLSSSSSSSSSTQLLRFIVALHQEDERCARAQPYLDMGVTILQVHADASTIVNHQGQSHEHHRDGGGIFNSTTAPLHRTFVASSGIRAMRQIEVEVLLGPGEYLIVPISTGCKFSQSFNESVMATSDSSRKFPGKNIHCKNIFGSTSMNMPVPLLRRRCWHRQDLASTSSGDDDGCNGVAAGSAGNCGNNDDGADYAVGDNYDDDDEFSFGVSKALDEVFERLDQDMDGRLNQKELNSFLQSTEALPLDRSVYLWLLKQFNKEQPQQTQTQKQERGGTEGNDYDDENNKDVDVASDCGNPDDGACGGLTRRGFRAAYMYMYKDSGGDASSVWRDLGFMGYHRQLPTTTMATMAALAASAATGAAEKVVVPSPQPLRSPSPPVPSSSIPGSSSSSPSSSSSLQPLSLTLMHARGAVLSLHAKRGAGAAVMAKHGRCGGVGDDADDNADDDDAAAKLATQAVNPSSSSSSHSKSPTADSDVIFDDDTDGNGDGGAYELAFELRTLPSFDPAVFREALELPIRRFGRCKILERGRLKLYTLKYGYCGISIAVENCTSSSYSEITSSSSKSKSKSSKSKDKESRGVDDGFGSGGGGRMLEFTMEFSRAKNVTGHRMLSHLPPPLPPPLLPVATATAAAAAADAATAAAPTASLPPGPLPLPKYNRGSPPRLPQANAEDGCPSSSSSASSLRVRVLVAPGGFQIVHHLLPSVAFEAWNRGDSKYKAQWFNLER